MSYRVHNGTPRDVFAHVFGVDYAVEAGKSISVTDPVTATTLCEYGLAMDPEAYAEALDEAAAVQRAENSAVSSASASEGQILGRQATVDVESGVVANGEAVSPVTTPAADPTHANDPVPASELTGAALDEALSKRGLSGGGKADEKRARVAEYDAQVASGDYVVGDDGLIVRDDAGELTRVIPTPEFEEADDDGSVILDGDGNPVPYGSPNFERDEAGKLILVDGVAVAKDQPAS